MRRNDCVAPIIVAEMKIDIKKLQDAVQIDRSFLLDYLSDGRPMSLLLEGHCAKLFDYKKTHKTQKKIDGFISGGTTEQLVTHKILKEKVDFRLSSDKGVDRRSTPESLDMALKGVEKVSVSDIAMMPTARHFFFSCSVLHRAVARGKMKASSLSMTRTNFFDMIIENGNLLIREIRVTHDMKLGFCRFIVENEVWRQDGKAIKEWCDPICKGGIDNLKERKREGRSKSSGQYLVDDNRRSR